MKLRQSPLAKAIGLAVLIASAPVMLTACGGGGGSGMSTPIVTPPPPPPPPPPAASTYHQNENQLIPTGVATAHKEGFTGKGVKVGFAGGWDDTDPTLDGKLAPDHQSHVVYYENDSECVQSPAPKDACGSTAYPGLTDNGHDEGVLEVLGGDPDPTGKSWGDPSTIGKGFAGGVAPGASLVVADVCDLGGCFFGDTAANTFISHGVRVISESFSGGVIGTFEPNVNYAFPLDDKLANAGVLQAIAAGDDSAQTSTYVSTGAPLKDPSLQPSIIAVTGVGINNDGKPIQQQPEKDAAGNMTGITPCLEDADWCVAAPDDLYNTYNMTPPKDGKPVTGKVGEGTSLTGSGMGTSNSAPEVAGEAALIAQAYPWMKAPQLSDTILSTATHLSLPKKKGDPLVQGGTWKPNKEFGWGLINAAKAVHGPARFIYPEVYGPFEAPVPKGVTSVFSNDIAGAGGLDVDGQGTLKLTGTDTYAGATTVTSGTLYIAGSITSGTTVKTAGTLDGVGTVGNVTSDGIVRSAGTKAEQGLTIHGDYTANKDATTAVALGDPLTVTGKASLGGTAEVLAAPKGYTVKATETLLKAGSIANTFDALTFHSGVFYNGTLGYTSTQVHVTLKQKDVQAAAAMMPQASPESVATAGHVQKALDTSNAWVTTGKTTGHTAWLQQAGAFLSAPNAAMATASLDSLSGEIYGTSRAVETMQALAADRAIGNREDALAHEQRPGVWAQVLGTDGTLARKGYASATYRNNGEMIGLDGQVTPRLSAGVAAGHVHQHMDMAGMGGRQRGTQNLWSVYARWNAPHRWYLGGRFVASEANLSLTRTLLLGTGSRTVSAQHGDRLDALSLEGGTAFAVGNGTLSPYLGATYLRTHLGRFHEKGSAMGLVAESQSHGSSLGRIGVRFTEPFGRSWVQGFAAYRHAFHGYGMGVTAAFVGVPGSTFVAEGQRLPRNLGIAGVRLHTQLTRQVSWFLDASYEHGSEGAHAAQADTGIRVAF